MADPVIMTKSSNLTGVTEHSFKRRLPGDVANVRLRLIETLESLRYTVLSDEPLQASRNGSFSMNILDCSLKLNVGLRQSTTASTIATFSYTIPLSMVTNGDLRTLESEADAVIALATMRPEANACVTCGTSNAKDSRFCRGCGAPNANGAPAEIEVMRLTAGTRAGHQTIVTGVIFILSILAITIPLILLGRPRREMVGWILLVLGQIIGWSTLIYGMLRLHRTLNPKTTVQTNHTPNLPGTVHTTKTAALPPQSAWSSVTEGTTELLSKEPRERVAASVEQSRPDTASIK